MPIHWQQVGKALEPKKFTVRSAAALLKASRPWADYDKAARPLQQAISRAVVRKSKKSR
jgi:bifunctional non-homologous end joining protein LigD